MMYPSVIYIHGWCLHPGWKKMTYLTWIGATTIYLLGNYCYQHSIQAAYNNVEMT